MLKPSSRALILLLTATVLSCQARPTGVADGGGRRGQVDPEIEFLIEQAPEPGAVLAQGKYIISGTIVSELGFRPESPLFLQVTNLDTGWLSMPVDVLQVAARGDQHGTSFNPSTGEFTIDGYLNWCLEEGPKRITLTVFNSNGDYKDWTVDVTATSALTPSRGEIIAARGAFFEQVGPILPEFRDFLAAHAYDLQSFPYAGMDLGLVNLLAETWTAVMTDPATGGWETAGLRMLTEAETLLALASNPVPTPNSPEDLYRQQLLKSLGWLETLLTHTRAWYIGGELGCRAPLATEASRRGVLGYFQHTYATVATSTGADMNGDPIFMFDARIFQDDGTPNLFTYEDFIPGSIQENTADPEDPAWRVTVVLTDVGNDGDIDQLDFDGVADHCAECPVEQLRDRNHYGHLITPLRSLFETRAFTVAGY